MTTLDELRKIGGFTEIENPHNSHRCHPDLLLDIIEAMMISRSDPTNETLLAKIKARKGQSIEQQIAESAPVREGLRELDMVLDNGAQAIKIAQRMLTCANFTLARIGKLRTVRAATEVSESLEIGTTGASGAKDGSGATGAGDDIIELLQERAKRVLSLDRQSQSVLDCSKAHLNQPCLRDEEDAPSEPGVPNYDHIADLLSHTSSKPPSDSESYIAQSIRVAKIAHEIEGYLTKLCEQVQKINARLDLIIAQCAVLISSRATIAQ